MASKNIVIYRLADDSIAGYYGFSNPATANLYPLDPATQGKIELSADHPSTGEQHKWRVNNGDLILKAEIVIAPDKTLIVADGVDEAVITFLGLVGDVDVSLGDGLNATILPADPTLILTSDVPRRFEIEVSDTLHWSDPISVEAQ